eukprot:s1688_g12.t1
MGFCHSALSEQRLQYTQVPRKRSWHHGPVATAGVAAGRMSLNMAAIGAGSAGTMPPIDASKFPLPLPEWLVGNPLFTAGFGLGAMGAAMSLLSRGASLAEVTFRRQMLMSLEIPSKDYAYQWVMQWMVANRIHGSRHLGVETTYSKDAAGRQMAAFDFIPSPGRHWVRWRGNFILVDRARETKTVDMSTGAPWETLTLTALSLRPNVFQEILAEAKEAALAREEGMTIIYQCYGHEWRPFGNPKRIRPFDSVVLDTGVADQVHADLQDFLQSQQWYLDRGIPYRRGYLLHGPPGCGKSSFVSALSGRLGYNICVLNLGDPSMTDDRLAHMLAVAPPRCVVLLEDVDFAVSQQTQHDPSGPYAGVTRVTFSGLLNALDGVIATEERVVFMTTNHYHALPRALVRPGRVDLSVYIGLASRSQLKAMYLRFFPGEEDLSETFATICEDEGLSMAELQGYFMFFKNKPEEAAANITAWLEERRKVHEEQLQKLREVKNEYERIRKSDGTFAKSAGLCRPRRVLSGSAGLAGWLWLLWLVWLVPLPLHVAAVPWPAIKLGQPVASLGGAPFDVRHERPLLQLWGNVSACAASLPADGGFGERPAGHALFAAPGHGCSGFLACGHEYLDFGWWSFWGSPCFLILRYLGWFVPQLVQFWRELIFGANQYKGIWSARFCGNRRVVMARKGWLLRHRARCRCHTFDFDAPDSQEGQHGPFCKDRETHGFHAADSFQFGFIPSFWGPFLEDSVPLDLERIFPSKRPPGLCRGGAAGSAATQRKRVEKGQLESRLLEGLVNLLSSFQQEARGSGPQKGQQKGQTSSTGPKGPDKGKGKGKPVPNGKGKGKDSALQKGAGSHQDADSNLLEALSRLVQRAQKKPAGLIDRLQNLTNAAINGRRLGKKKKKKTRQVQGASVQNSDAPWLRVVQGKGISEDQFRKRIKIFKLRSLDWPGYTVVPSCQKLGLMLDKKAADSKFVVLAQNNEEVSKILEVIHGDSSANVTVVVPTGVGVPVQCPDFPQVTFKESRVPLVDGNGRVITKVVGTWGRTDVFSNSAIRVVVPSDKRPAGPNFDSIRNETLVLRVTLDSRFCNSLVWKGISQKPGPEVRKWILKLCPACQGQLLDTWGWELQSGAGGPHSVVKGLIRIKKGAWIGSLLPLSGRLSDGIRCFLDPLNWEATPSEAFGSKPFVSWVEKKPKESDGDYAGRVSSLATAAGVARGWRQLGLRSMHKPASQNPQVRSWTLRAAPRFWSFEQVLEFLTAAGFKDVSINSKGWERAGTSWGFRGSWKDGQTYVQLLYEGDSFESGKFLVAERAQNGLRDKKILKLKGETRVQLGPVATKAAEVAPTQMEVDDSQNDQAADAADDGQSSPMEEVENADGRGASEKRTTSTVGVTPDKKRHKPRPLPADVIRIPNTGEGNCLFQSIADALARNGKGSYSHRDIRATIVSHLKRHKEKYFCFWDHKDPNEKLCADVTLEGFSKYIDLVGQVGAWGGNLEIAAAAATMDTPICIIHEQGQVYQYNAEGSRKDIFLYFQAAGHYEALAVSPESALALRTKAMPGAAKGGRKGGAKSASSLGGHTRKSAPSSLGGRTRQPASSLGHKTRKSSGPCKAASSSIGGRTAVAPGLNKKVLSPLARTVASKTKASHAKAPSLDFSIADPDDLDFNLGGKAWAHPVDPTVVILQELRMDGKELEAFRRSARKAGFLTFAQPGHPAGPGTPRGGVVILVDSRLAARPAFSGVSDNAQLVSVWVENILILGCYTPPNYQNELCQLFVEAFVVINPPCSDTWVCGGDFNEIPGDSMVSDILQGYGGTVLAQGIPTRWNGFREVDWFATNHSQFLTYPCCGEDVHSDHKSIHVTVTCNNRDWTYGALQKTSSWARPAEVPVQVWRQALEMAWETVGVPVDLVDLPVQTAWDTFNSLLSRCFLLAFRIIGSDPRFSEVQLPKTAAPKGFLPEWKSRSLRRRGAPERGEPFSIRKCRRKLARCFELKRLLVRQGFVETSHANLAIQRLVAKLQLDPQRSLSAQARALIFQLQAQLHELETARRQQKLDAWKDRMSTDLKAVGRWLRDRESSQSVSSVTWNDRSACGHGNIAALIFDFWDHFWQSANAGSPPIEDRIQCLQQNAVGADIIWEPPSDDELTQVFRRASGASGTDGWTGDEVKHLPVACIKVFKRLALAWAAQDVVPEQFCESRMVVIPKDNRIRNGSVSVEHTRPISVCSIWWRVWCGAVVKSSSCREWVSRAVPPAVVAGRGPSSEAQCAAAEVFDAICRDRFGCSLDFQKAYDLMDPRGTLELMSAGGFPPWFVSVCKNVWLNQLRWIVYDGHVHPAPLPAGVATAQGDPFGPLALQLWMSSGLGFVLSHLSPGDDWGSDKIYMDDRSFSAPTSRVLLLKQSLWSRWSGLVGLRESVDKVQYFFADKGAQVELEASVSDPCKVVNSGVVLGCVVAFTARKEAPKEKHRVDKACRACLSLSCLRLPWARYLLYVRIFALSQAIYGWVSRLPTLASSWRLWSAVRSGSRVLRVANRHLRCILDGGLSNLDVVTAVQLLRVVLARARLGQLPWVAERGSPLAALKLWFRSRGWSVVRDWVWVVQGCPQTLVDLSDAVNANFALLAHALRLGWRWHHWNAFKRSGRHDADIELAFREFCSIDFSGLRDLMVSNPGVRSVVVGSVLSPACFQHEGRRVFSDRYPVQARFGWVITGGDFSVPIWLGQVVQRIWDVRYGRDAAKTSKAPVDSE